MKIWIWALLVGLLLCCDRLEAETIAPIVSWTRHSSDPSASPCPGSPETCSAWLKFRTAHPWPYQVYAVSNTNGHVVAIISEPAPTLDRADLEQLARAAFGDNLISMSRYRWATGVDGWLEDLVLTLKSDAADTATPVLGPNLAPWNAPSEIVEPLKFIDFALHGTRDGFWMENVDAPPSPTPIPSVQVHPADVASWVESSGTWASVGDDENSSRSWAAMVGQPGTYSSSANKLVALVVGKGAPLANARVAFRRFAIESDLLVGAVRPANGNFVLVGRPRQIALSDLPPLRFETFAALAARRSDELAQSYERQRVFAGKILSGEFAGWDWAPILLSKQVEDSEFGTLLNEADQVLKSWSEAGKINYFDFPVKAPDKFPFETGPLSAEAQRQLQAPSIVFNWNTQGFSVLTEQPIGRVLTADRSGALPVLYLPLSETGAAVDDPADLAQDWAEKGRKYFEDSGHPLVARVAQNVFLYQAVNNLLTAPLANADASNARSQVALDAVQAIAKEWIAQQNSGPVSTDPARAEVQREVRRLMASPGMSLEKAAELLATSQISTRRLTQIQLKINALPGILQPLFADRAEKEAVYSVAFDRACAEAVRLGGPQARAASGCHFEATNGEGAKFDQLKQVATAREKEVAAADKAYEDALAAARADKVAYDRESANLELAQRLGRKITASASLTADLDQVKDRVLATAAGVNTEGSIRTPTLVLSQNEEDPWAIGGHNVAGRLPVVKAKRFAAVTAQRVRDGEVDAPIPPRPVAEALGVKSNRPGSMLAIVRSRADIPPERLSPTLARLTACAECRAVVEAVDGDTYSVARRPPAGGRAELVRGASGLIDALADAKDNGGLVQFYGVDAQWARAVTQSAMIRDSITPKPASFLEQATALFIAGGGGRKPPSPPHFVVEVPSPEEPGKRDLMSIFGDPGRARAKPTWAQATVKSPEVDPSAWLAAHPEVRTARGTRDTHPTVVIIAFPSADSVAELTTVMETSQADAASAGPRLQALMRERTQAAAATQADLATMLAATRTRIVRDLKASDVSFFVEDNLGDLRMAAVRR